ncbi:MAG TPA: hypothetical protein VGL72_29375 [Bryobacteraceae bacterium]
MISRATPKFWQLLHALPPSIQTLAEKNYRLWREDPHHASLRFRRLQGSQERYTVRIGDHYRALATVKGGVITWVWIGTHEEYNRLVKA